MKCRLLERNGHPVDGISGIGERPQLHLRAGRHRVGDARDAAGRSGHLFGLCKHGAAVERTEGATVKLTIAVAVTVAVVVAVARAVVLSGSHHTLSAADVRAAALVAVALSSSSRSKMTISRSA